MPLSSDAMMPGFFSFVLLIFVGIGACAVLLRARALRQDRRRDADGGAP